MIYQQGRGCKRIFSLSMAQLRCLYCVIRTFVQWIECCIRLRIARKQAVYVPYLGSILYDTGNLAAPDMVRRPSTGTGGCFCHVQRRAGMSMKGRYFDHCLGRQDMSGWLLNNDRCLHTSIVSNSGATL